MKITSTHPKHQPLRKEKKYEGLITFLFIWVFLINIYVLAKKKKTKTNAHTHTQINKLYKKKLTHKYQYSLTYPQK